MAARKSPTQSANDFKVGTRKQGNDGETWVVARVKPKSGNKKPYNQWRRVAKKQPVVKRTAKERAILKSLEKMLRDDGGDDERRGRKKDWCVRYTLAVDSGLIALGDAGTQPEADALGPLLDKHKPDAKTGVRLLGHLPKDIFLLCFSYLDFQSFINIKENWLPEVRYAPHVGSLSVWSQAIYVPGAVT